MFGAAELDELEAAVDGLCLSVDLDVHRRLTALCQRLEAVRVAHAVELDASGLFELDGATSMAAWLRSECGVGRAAAGRTVKVGRVLRDLPVVAAAFADGALAQGQIEAIVEHVHGHGHVARFAVDEASLVPMLAPLNVRQVDLAMQEWKARAEALDDASEPAQAKTSTVHLSKLGGRGVLSGDLDAHLTELAITALRTAEAHELDRKPSECRADALHTIFEQFLNAQGVAYSKRHRRHRPHLNLVVQVSEGVLQGRYVDGPPVDPATLDTLLCDCRLHRVLTDPELGIVGYGRGVRTVPPDLFNALVARDEHCRWPGCELETERCDGHHVAWWESHGGRTDLDNLVLLCRRHHRMLHVKDPATRQPRWTATLEPNGTLTTTRTADGLTRTSRPPGLEPRLL